MRTDVLPGQQIRALNDFYRLIGAAVNGPGGYFGSNLDALADCLRGGMGTPADGFAIRWEQSAASRAALDHKEMVRLLEEHLRTAHPSGRGAIERKLDLARRGEGPTLFDW